MIYNRCMWLLAIKFVFIYFCVLKAPLKSTICVTLSKQRRKKTYAIIKEVIKNLSTFSCEKLLFNTVNNTCTFLLITLMKYLRTQWEKILSLHGLMTLYPQLLYQILLECNTKRLINEAHFISNPTIPSKKKKREEEKIYIKACLFFFYISHFHSRSHNETFRISFLYFSPLYKANNTRKAFTCSKKNSFLITFSCLYV
jgi:hypothetical protein